MKEIRLNTKVRRMRPLKVYALEPSVSAVPCQSDGIAHENSFTVSLYLSENNKERQPAQAHMRYVRYKGASCEAAVESGVPVSAVTVDTGRSEGKAYDKFVIQAYTPAAAGRHEAVLATLHVSTVRDGEPGRPGSSTIIVPYGSWQAGRTYRSTEDVKIFVERHEMYYVLIRLNEDCLNIDPATDVKNEWWRLMDYVEYMFVNAMVADFGKIASTVFFGNYMLSQYGKTPDGQPVQTEKGYEAFTPDMNKFIPNILLNFLTGYAHFAGGNVKFNEDGSVDIVGSISSNANNKKIKFDAGTNSITMTSEGREVMTLSFEESVDSIGARPYLKMMGPINRLTGSLPTMHIRSNGISLVMKGNRGYNLEFILSGDGLTFKKEKLTAEGLVLSSKTTSYPAPANW